MDKRTTSIIAIVVSVLLCGCPGFGACLWGGLIAAGLSTYTTTLGETTSSGQTPVGFGIVSLCIGVLLMLIPVAVAFFTLRKKPENSENLSMS